MQTPTAPRRTFQRPSRAQSIFSDSQSPSINTPRPTPPPPPPPPPKRRGRGVRANSVASEAFSVTSATENATPQKAGVKLPAHYLLPPTYPSPFTGTLEKSLDAIQEWGRVNMNVTSETGTRGIQSIVDALLKTVDSRTNWPVKLLALQENSSERTRYLTEELLFLVTRTLLPEQIVENRSLMARLYDRKKQLAMRLVLRYDMLREWKMESGTYHREQAVAMLSVPPLRGGDNAPDAVPVSLPSRYPFRRARLPNIFATLVAAPVGGFTTHGVRERMKHHVTDLDAYLLLEDDEVAGWSGVKLLAKVCQVILHWQWLRQNNEVLDEMEVQGWEELEGKADESEWIADDVKRNATGVGVKKNVGQGGGVMECGL